MMEAVPDRVGKKRVLKKIRRDFLYKKADDEDNKMIDPTTKYIGDSQFLLLNKCLVLYEQKRKICLGLRVLSGQLKIERMIITNHSPESKSIVWSFKINPDKLTLPLEYTIKRLESYGDLELAIWARRLRNYHLNYSKIMEKYFESLQLNDPKINARFQDSQAKARLACKEIESRCSYKKVTLFANKESIETLSSITSENFLKELGYNIETFLLKIEREGLPTFFEEDCFVNMQIAQRFLDCLLFDGDSIQEGDEHITVAEDAEGQRTAYISQFVGVTEPTTEGLFIYIYFIIRKKVSEIEDQGQNGILNQVIDKKKYKYVKEDDDIILK